MLMTRVSQSELGCLLTDRPTLSILAEFACIFPYVCVVCGNKNKHDSDERAPKWEIHSIALNDAEQVMIFTVAVTIADESVNPRVRTGVQKATHITKHVVLNGLAIVKAFKTNLLYAFPVQLTLSKGALLLFSLRMWHMYSPSFTANNVCCLNHSSVALHTVSQGWSDSSADKWQLESVAKFQPVWIALGPKTVPEQIW